MDGGADAGHEKIPCFGLKDMILRNEMGNFPKLCALAMALRQPYDILFIHIHGYLVKPCLPEVGDSQMLEVAMCCIADISHLWHDGLVGSDVRTADSRAACGFFCM